MSPPNGCSCWAGGFGAGGGGMSMVAAGRGLVGSMKLGRSATSPWSELRRAAARWPPVPVRGLSCICSSAESSLCRHRSPPSSREVGGTTATLVPDDMDWRPLCRQASPALGLSPPPHAQGWGQGCSGCSAHCCCCSPSRCLAPCRVTPVPLCPGPPAPSLLAPCLLWSLSLSRLCGHRLGWL